MKRPRDWDYDDFHPPRKIIKLSDSPPDDSKICIDLTQTNDNIPAFDISSNEPIKVYIHIDDLNNKLKPGKVSKLHCNEDINDIQISSSSTDNYMFDIPPYEDFDYEDDGQGSYSDKTIDYSSDDENNTYGVDWSFDYLNDD